MEAFFNSLLTQYGLSGVIIGLLIWNQFQSSKNIKSSVSKEDLNDAKKSIQSNIEGQIDNIKSYVETEREVLKEMIDMSDTKLEMWKEHIDNKFELMDKRLDKQPSSIIHSIQKQEMLHKEQHDKMFDKQLILAPAIHDTLSKGRVTSNADHIFLGSFHNGTSNLSGVPYYKFDLVAEKYCPDKVDRDTEFAHMYYNADLMKYDKLPITLIQNGYVHYIIDDNQDSELSKISDIIYRRMVGRNIKQLAIQLIADETRKPMGFVGCVRYDYEDINKEGLKNCAEQIEKLYRNL